MIVHPDSDSAQRAPQSDSMAAGSDQDKLGRSVVGAPLPRIIQGGMGAAVSGWNLAGAVAREGHLGVVSGTALEIVYARRLQRGDPGGHIRRAFSRFHIPEMAERVWQRYFVAGGIGDNQHFKGVPMYSLEPARVLQELAIVANFAEVFLARDKGRGGPVGINNLFKITMPLLGSIYGAMLAGVDYILVGAGNPHQLPALLDKLARGEDAALPLRVQQAGPGQSYEVRFSPHELMGAALQQLPRPRFLAIVASSDLAQALIAEPVGPDGFIVEGHVAGGHNAPPRGPLRLDSAGQPQYGVADEVACAEMVKLGKPFWLAGSYGAAGGLQRALRAGASGIQVGTAFALCRESGMAEPFKRAILQSVARREARVVTDIRASPTSFPFKVFRLPGSLSDGLVYAQRKRICDAGMLRTPFVTNSGAIGYRCPAEDQTVFVKKGGRRQNTEGRMCLCNGLLATVDLATVRRDGYREPPLITLGDHVESVRDFLPSGQTSYTAADVIARLEERPTHLFPGPPQTAGPTVA